jgi:hypothetical protein
VLALKVGGERVTIGAGRTADDVPLLIVAGMAGGIVPRPVIGPSTQKNRRSWSAMIRKNAAGGSGSDMGFGSTVPICAKGH